MLRTMEKISFFLLILAVLGPLPADLTDTEALPRFFSGTLTVPGEFPSIVSIQGPVIAHCGGVIVNVNHVITSAQCVFNATNHLINPFFLRIIAGDLNIAVPSFRRHVASVSHIYPHPQYNPVNRNNDIAVLRVIESFPFPHNTIDLAIRSVRVLPDGTSCRTAGWGSAVTNGTVSVLQQAITVPIMNRDQCNGFNVHAGQVLESMICAGTVAQNAPSTCTGNIGTGFFCHDELIGILTFGLGCGLMNNPGVYTQVRFHEAFIVQQFTRTDMVMPGTPAGVTPGVPGTPVV